MRLRAALLLGSLALCACDCDEKTSAQPGPSAAGLEAPEAPTFGRAPEPALAEPAPRRRDQDFVGPAGPAGAAGAVPASFERLGALAQAPGALFDGSIERPEGPERVLGTFKRRASDSTPVVVRELGGPGGRLVFESGMTIDTDGRIRDPEARRRIAREDRHHQGDTALHYADGSPLDPTRVPYIVLPQGFGGAQNGDLALVEHGGRKVLAVVGDRGPRRSLGEASIAVAQALGIDSHGGRGGVESGVRYTVFPGTAGFNPRNEAALLSFINDTGSQVASGKTSPAVASS